MASSGLSAALEIPQLKRGVADFHEATGYVVFSLSGIDIQFGKDEAMWGPGLMIIWV